jgi:hypothetical protein
MSSPKQLRHKRFFTLVEANSMLPLLCSILRDVTRLAAALQDRRERLHQLHRGNSSSPGRAHYEEVEQVETEFERDREQMEEYEKELKDLGVELKDYFVGLIDFPAVMDNRKIYLCWRLGEPEVGHWHEVDAGFAGRQPILENATRN